MHKTAKKIAQAIAREKNNKDYAKHYFAIEDVNGLQNLDTQILDKILKKDQLVFDATMGPGRHVIYFAKKGVKMFGNDYNPHMVTKVKQLLSKEKLVAELYNCDITNLSTIDSNNFDYIICMHGGLGVVPQNTQRLQAAKEFFKILKPGGQLIMHAHNRLDYFLSPRYFFWILKHYLAAYYKKIEIGDVLYEEKKLGLTYIHYFTTKELERLLKKAGFKIKEKIYLDGMQEKILWGWAEKWRSGGFIFVAEKP